MGIHSALVKLNGSKKETVWESDLWEGVDMTEVGEI